MNKASGITMNMLKVNKVHLFLGIVVGVLFCYLFKDTFAWLYGRWTEKDTFYSHGFLIPLISVGLYWGLRKIEVNSATRQFAWVPVAGMTLSILIHFTGVFLTVNFLKAVGMISFIVFAGWYLLGWSAFKKRWAPFLFLFFMLPLPNIVLNKITVPLKIIVSKLSVTILDLVGISYVAKGFEVELAAGSMYIDNPCSGLRSLISFFAMAFIFSYLIRFEKWKSILLFGLTLPIALLCNILRVQFLFLAAHYWGTAHTKPGAAAHDYSGMIMFGLGLVIFFLIFHGLSNEHK